MAVRQMGKKILGIPGFQSTAAALACGALHKIYKTNRLVAASDDIE